MLTKTLKFFQPRENCQYSHLVFISVPPLFQWFEVVCKKYEKKTHEENGDTSKKNVKSIINITWLENKFGVRYFRIEQDFVYFSLELLLQTTQERKLCKNIHKIQLGQTKLFLILWSQYDFFFFLIQKIHILYEDTSQHFSQSCYDRLNGSDFKDFFPDKFFGPISYILAQASQH